MPKVKAFLGFGIVLVLATTAWAHSSTFGRDAPSLVAQTSGWQQVSYKKDVDPILQRNCAVCHTPGGAGYAKSRFSVQSYQTVMKGTKYGPVVVPGSSSSSNLVWLLKHGASSSVNMPRAYEVKALSPNKYVIVPKGPQWLSARDVWLISGWIEQGAKDN